MAITFDDDPIAGRAAEGKVRDSASENDQVSLHDLVRRLVADRARRGDWFDSSLFSDPAWDLMVNVFLDHLDGRDSSVRKLIVGTFLTPEIAIRWLNVLEQKGTVAWCDVDVVPHTRVRLTERGVVGMVCYLRGLAKRWHLRIRDDQAA